MYIFKSVVGTFSIQLVDGRFALCFAGDILGIYNSAVAAADDVYTHTTGLYEWDILDGEIMDAPSDICEWDYIRF